MAAAAGGLLALPAWANGWTQESLKTSGFLTAPQEEILAEIVETILPATSTPGAKALGVHTFIEKIVADCLDPKAQETFKKGLAATDASAKQLHGKAFTACDATQRTDVISRLSDSDKSFFSQIKGLTVRGYTSSEYYMTNIAHYKLIPGHYYGCVPLNK
ncbi:MAG: gluconate 2-dehydrogenase subunit 3 family protein [Siphonobacter aquaeclarae]|nr:gluconate 2-dehydrogenase subunit 3 family protein [Siphonobacter aquaeclarae]